MADVTIHFREQPAEQRTVPGIPRVGELIDDGRLWRVAAVVYGEAIHVYSVRVSDDLAGELRAEWAAWGEAPALPQTAESQHGAF